MEQEDLEELYTYLRKNPGFAAINRKVAGKLKRLRFKNHKVRYLQDLVSVIFKLCYFKERKIH